MRTWREAYADYEAARELVQEHGGVIAAHPSLVKAMCSARQEAARRSAAVVRLELDAHERRN